MDPRVTVVIPTLNRRERLLATLELLERLAERPAVVVVDDGSTDGTSAAVRRRHPHVHVVPAGGQSPRTRGTEVSRTPCVAFSDDDSWWAPGALTRAADLLDAHPRLGLIAARIVVEPGGRLDPTCREMAESPLAGNAGLPGTPVLGFVACGAVARRSALLACRGFDPRIGFGGEETLVALDLASGGWAMAYVEEVVAHHEPGDGARPGRGRAALRNDLLITWARRPAARAVSRTATVITRNGRAGLLAVVDALREVGWVVGARRRLPPRVEHALRRLEAKS